MKVNSRTIIPELRALYPLPWGFAGRVANKLGLGKREVYNVVYGYTKHANRAVIDAIAEDVTEQKLAEVERKKNIKVAATL
jgi:hypothetical protein